MKRILVAGEKIISTPEHKIVLEAKGYQLLLMKDLHSALSLILEDPPDMLIMEKAFGEEKSPLALLNAVKDCRQKTNIPVILIVDEKQVLSGLDWQKYAVDDFIVCPFTPELLRARIRLAEARMIRVFDNNPLSRLPGNTSILQAIQRAIDSDESHGVCYIDIDNFKPYNDRYGFSQGDDVILMVARIAVNVIDELAREGSFVGHVGGDDFVFIVKEDKVKPVCERILANFEVVRNMFIPDEDLKAGCYVEKDRQGRETVFGLLSLSIAVVITGAHHFKHYGEVSTIASEIKHFVKKKEGSNYMIDRRSQV
ncbi:MAG: diguanylate cyclase [Desulfobulbaceae bacterium]|nr:diguanylate cyclase [Desulfobulbaceae bacterium]